MQKKTWQEDSFWDVVKVQMDLSGAAGKSYGLLTWRGTRLHEEPRRIPGTRKKVWRAMEEASGVRNSNFQALRMDAAVIESLAAEAGRAEAGGAAEAAEAAEAGEAAEAAGEGTTSTG